MEIRFLGPLGMVTGSCTWMRDIKANWNFLIDCGMQQGERGADKWNRGTWPFDPTTIQFVVLTHAHIDHCGLLPRLYKDGFRGKVYCTRETKELATIALADAARHPGAPYQFADVKRILWHEPRKIPLLGGSFHPVGKDLYLRFFRTGHILGAVSVAVYWGPKDAGQRSIVFSGDLGPYAEDAENLPFLRYRMHPVPCDYAVVESTYGGTIRPTSGMDADSRRAQLRALLDRSINEEGLLVLPSFSLGRTQDLLFDLHWIVAENPARYGALNYYFDAPTASRMHPVMLEAFERTETNGVKGKVRPLWLGKQMFRWFGMDDTDPQHIERVLDLVAMTLGIRRSDSARHSEVGNEVARAWRPIMNIVENRRALLDAGLPKPAVLLTGSGSCDGGPAASWLPRLLTSPRTTIALSGYCPPDTVGGQLMTLKDTSQRERERHLGRLQWGVSNELRVADMKASVEKLSGYSAHADQNGLVEWLFWEFKGDWRASGSTVFIQHGEDGEREKLSSAIHQRARQLEMLVYTVSPDDQSKWYDLEAGGAKIDRETRKSKLLVEMKRLQDELDLVMA